MSKRDPLQDRLSALAAAAGSPDSPSAGALLDEALAKGPGLAVAKAAKIVADAWERPEAAARRGAWADRWTPPLLAAYARCCDGPARHDRGAFGKTALAEALDRMEHGEAAPFVRGVAYVQPEPSMGGPVDKAAPLRARSLAALVRLRHPERLLWLAEMLWDPCQDARLGAVRAAVHEGTEAAGALLRAKAVAGDRGADDKPLATDGGAEVAGAVFEGLLALDAGRHAAFVARFLRQADVSGATRDQAALALGESRHPEALRGLAGARDAADGGDGFRRLVAGLATHGSDGALAALAAWRRSAGSGDRRILDDALRDIWGVGSPRYRAVAGGGAADGADSPEG